jgi:predicted DNA-binding antitoxin AbrB/MazE fold protein
MKEVIEATFDGEVFRPTKKPDILPNSKVHLIVEILPDAITQKRERLLKITEQTRGAWANNPEIDKAMEELNQTYQQWDAYLKSL